MADSTKSASAMVEPATFMLGADDEFAVSDDFVDDDLADDDFVDDDLADDDLGGGWEIIVEHETKAGELGAPRRAVIDTSELNENQIVTVDGPEELPQLASSVGDYIVEVGDQVLLKFLNRPDLNETLIVGADGVIAPAIAPPIYAVGKTVSMLKAELAGPLLARRYNAVANRDGNRAVEYFIAVDDVIEVRFSVLEDLSDTVTVRPDGRISLARIGEVTAEGRTPSELQSELENLYKDEVKQPELVVIMRKTTSPDLHVDGVAVPAPIKGIGEFSVEVIKSAPRLVYVMGEVSLPSAIPYQPNMTALRAIGSSGGTKRTANLKHVMILRSNGPCNVREIAVDLRPCRTCTSGINSHTDGGFADVPLLPNDVILVPQTRIAKVQDWLDQYVYNLFPPLRNSSAFNVLYNNGIPGFNASP